MARHSRCLRERDISKPGTFEVRPDHIGRRLHEVCSPRRSRSRHGVRALTGGGGSTGALPLPRHSNRRRNPGCAAATDAAVDLTQVRLRADSASPAPSPTHAFRQPIPSRLPGYWEIAPESTMNT